MVDSGKENVEWLKVIRRMLKVVRRMIQSSLRRFK